MKKYLITEGKTYEGRGKKLGTNERKGPVQRRRVIKIFMHARWPEYPGELTEMVEWEPIGYPIYRRITVMNLTSFAAWAEAESCA
jgi:hypothetical protein